MRLLNVFVMIGVLNASGPVFSQDNKRGPVIATGRSYLDVPVFQRPGIVMGMSLAVSWWQRVNGETSYDDCLLGKTSYGAMSELLSGYIQLDDSRLEQRLVPLFLEAVSAKCKIDLGRYMKHQ